MTWRDLEAFYQQPTPDLLASPDIGSAHKSLLEGLEAGTIRAALPTAQGWQAQTWVKTAILVGFRAFPTQEMPTALGVGFDRGGYPPRELIAEDEVRLVPGGSAIRRGAYVASGVVVMPPAYVNVGAWVDSGTMIDSHALVGSCAQVGKNVHLSAGVQIGGVLEPAKACPVVVEDDAFLGAQSGVFEGVVVGAGAVLAPATHLTASTRIFDLVRETVWTGQVPPGAVVVPGSRRAKGAWAEDHGLTLYVPVIVKYRDEATATATALEEALR